MEYNKVINYICTNIMNGKFVTGTKLPTERALAKELSVSRSIVREAVRILHGMGIVESIQGSGNYISDKVSESVEIMLTLMLALGTVTKEDVCEYRRTIERTMCSLLIEKGISEENKKKFVTILEGMDNAGVDEEGEFDKKFHEMLVVSSENTLISVVMKSVMPVYRQWIDDVLSKAKEEDKLKLRQYHRGIFNGIIAKDKAMTLKNIEDHYNLIWGYLNEDKEKK